MTHLSVHLSFKDGPKLPHIAGLHLQEYQAGPVKCHASIVAGKPWCVRL